LPRNSRDQRSFAHSSLFSPEFRDFSTACPILPDGVAQ
jgi:hypothetical protein